MEVLVLLLRPVSAGLPFCMLFCSCGLQCWQLQLLQKTLGTPRSRRCITRRQTAHLLRCSPGGWQLGPGVPWLLPGWCSLR